MGSSALSASSSGRLLAVALFSLAIGLSGCKSWRHRGEEQTAPDKLYEKAHKALGSGDFDNAVKMYESLEARYPFSVQGKQSRLDIIYAYYKADQKESAVDAADQFIRENPTHPRIDYAYYMKGLVYFERTPNMVERWFRADLTLRPPQDSRKSFQALQTLVDRYPDSMYAPDARSRMVYLRNRLASYEVSVADFYLRRRAYVASLDRAKYCIENYDGAPAVRQALDIMIAAYDGLGSKDLADQARAVYALNYPDTKPKREKRRWYQFW
jgi:outer membrane protein assembly factor BamD